MPLFKTNPSPCTLEEENTSDHVCLLCFANYPEESFVSISINTAVMLGFLLCFFFPDEKLKRVDYRSVVGSERFVFSFFF